MPSTLGLAEGMEDTIHILPVPRHDVEALVRPALCPLSPEMMLMLILMLGSVIAVFVIVCLSVMTVTLTCRDQGQLASESQHRRRCICCWLQL